MKHILRMRRFRAEIICEIDTKDTFQSRERKKNPRNVCTLKLGLSECAAVNGSIPKHNAGCFACCCCGSAGM